MKRRRCRYANCRRLQVDWKHGRLCRIHYLDELKTRRRYRRQLAFCWHCLKRALPGLTVCTKHQAVINKASLVYREKQAAKRGWRMAKVPVAK